MIDLNKTRRWHNARWIGCGACHNNWQAPVLPAPCFRAEFDFDGEAASVQSFICGLGYHVLFINGKRVGDHELSPTVSIYDKHARYVTHEIRAYVHKGRNAVGVILGTGWYDSHTQKRWHFDRASWRDYPKLILEIEAEKKSLLVSGSDWKVSLDGPLRKDGLMTGENYDARLEPGDWTLPGYDDSAWKNAAIVPGPGGRLVEETFPPVRVRETLPMHKSKVQRVWDAGVIVSGRARIRVRGEAGAVIRMRFSDTLDANGNIYMDHIAMYAVDDLFQTDIYTLKGNSAGECWAPSFTYHCFRYADVEITGNAEILEMTAEVLCSDFRQTGHFHCSDPVLNKLFDCTVRSFTDNFVGIPTDCPHREKNGWTGDAVCAADTGLALFDAADSYTGWLQDIADCQRPDGALPGIVPSGGWGFNWGNGPFYSYVLTGIVLAIRRFTGDEEPIRKFYPQIKKVVEFCNSIADDGIISVGLGDWAHYVRSETVDKALPLTAFYYAQVRDAAVCAGILGKKRDERSFIRLSGKIAAAFEKHFYQGNGIYGKGEPTAMAAAVYLGLCPKERCSLVMQRLNEALQKHDYKAWFGIIGAKFIPELLSEYGYADEALRLVTQDQVPGWAAWLKDGATALRETWDSKASHCHIMFGGIAFWVMKYLAGLSPDTAEPGYRTVVIAPVIPQSLSSAEGSVETPYGTVISKWSKDQTGNIDFDIVIPEGISARLKFSGHPEKTLHTGKNHLHFPIH